MDWWMFIPAREDPWSNTIYEAGQAHGQGKYRVLRGLASAGCGSSGAVGPTEGVTTQSDTIGRS